MTINHYEHEYLLEVQRSRVVNEALSKWLTKNFGNNFRKMKVCWIYTLNYNVYSVFFRFKVSAISFRRDVINGFIEFQV
jgi:hypothetical protein